MKFVMSLLVAASFATPAFAKEAALASKNRKEIETVVVAAKKSTQELNEEERTRGANAYRLEELQDPNAEAGRNKKSWSIKPYIGGNRKRILTPPELEREQREGKHSTYIGSEVALKYSTPVGAKLTVKFGGAKQ